jgi:hypothetical protein
MSFSTLSILQWFLIIWLLTILMKCIFEIFDKEPPSGLFFGLFLIVVGCFWFLNLKNSTLLQTWISGFFVSGLFGIILISSGIRILLRPPLRSWIAGSVILIMAITLTSYGPSRKNSPSFLDFLNNISLHHFWSQEWIQDKLLDNNQTKNDQFFGKLMDENLTLSLSKTNVWIKNETLNQQFSIRGETVVKPDGELSYKIDTQPGEDVDISINPTVKNLTLRLEVGNLSGEIKNKMNQVDYHVDTGNVNFTAQNHINKMNINTNMGNVFLSIYEPVDDLLVNTNIGNIEIHAKKGILILIEAIDTKVGNKVIKNETNDSKGICRIKVKTDIGNITIINDL